MNVGSIQMEIAQVEEALEDLEKAGPDYPAGLAAKAARELQMERRTGVKDSTYRDQAAALRTEWLDKKDELSDRLEELQDALLWAQCTDFAEENRYSA